MIVLVRTQAGKLKSPQLFLGFPVALVVKNVPAHTRDASSVPVLGRSPGEGNDNPLQYSCLENPVDRGAWQATVYEVTKSQTRQHRCAHEVISRENLVERTVY